VSKDKIEKRLQDILFNQDKNISIEKLNERELLYRSMIRANIIDAIIYFAPAATKINKQKLCGWIDEWLEEKGPQTRLFWQLGCDFSDWLFESKLDKNDRHLVELIHFETLQLEVERAPDLELINSERTIYPNKKYLLNPALRIAIYEYPVHLMEECGNKLPALKRPICLMLNRCGDLCKFTEIPAQIAQLIGFIEQEKTINQAIAALAEIYGQVDEKFIRSHLIFLLKGQHIFCDYKNK
jgi:hypothetical protein